MSYGIDLLFRRCESLGTAAEIAIADANALYAKREQVLEGMRYFIPSIRYCKEQPEVDRFWVEHAMKLNYVFWPDLHILGLIGSWRDLFKANNRPKHVYFQNSCDQDYDFDSWNGICPEIDQIVQQCTSRSIDDWPEAKNRLAEEDNPSKWEGYVRRSLCYENVFSLLDLGAVIYGNEDSDVFTRFSVSALNTQERELEARVLVKRLVSREKKEE